VNRETINFINSLKKYREILSKQVIKTLRGQDLSGNLEGAKKGLQKGVGVHDRTQGIKEIKI